MAETPGGNQTPGKASKKLKDSKFGETIFEEVRSRYTAALSHLPDPALVEGGRVGGGREGGARRHAIRRRRRLRGRVQGG